MVFIVDNTLSMSAQVGGVSNFERARTMLANQAAEMKTDDRIAVLPMIDMPLGEGRTVNTALPPGPVLERAINELRQGYGTGDPASVLRRAAELTLAADTPNREIYLLSDFQAATFFDFVDSGAAKLFETRTEANVYLVDFADTELRSAAPRRGFFRSGPPGSGKLNLVCEAVNFSERDFDIRMSVVMDGKKVCEQTSSIKGGEKLPFEFEVIGGKEGFHECAVVLDGDDIPGDNTLYLSLYSAPVLKILVVNGRTSSVNSLDAAWYFRCALDPRWRTGQSGLAGIATTEVKPDEFSPALLDGVDAVALLDCPDFSPTLVDSIASFVLAGGGLIVAPGPSTDAAKLTRALTGGTVQLVPAKALKTASTETQDGYFVNFSSLSLQHPLWAGIAEKSLQLLCNEPQTSVLQLDAEAGFADKEILASFNNSWPAIVTGRVGSGRVLLFAFPLDTTWSGLPFKPVFPVLAHRSAHFASGTLSGVRSSVLVGQKMGFYLRRSNPDMKFRVDYPGMSLDLMPRLTSEGFSIEAPAAVEPGFVKFRAVEAASFKGQFVAVNTPGEEGNPDFMALGDVSPIFEGLNIVDVDDPGKLAEVRTRLKAGLSLWGYILFLALILLAVESWLANDVLRRISAGRNAEAATYGPLSKKAIVSLRKQRRKDAS
jgi:hypothetical protein